ncbi:MAG TPA: hypothetical protein VGO52_12310 [Hyphomonadaceae bacterium]|jgi:hypothetical protein|nr:hypothetical protein [Hyphomonadaceae bacterium]
MKRLSIALAFAAAFSGHAWAYDGPDTLADTSCDANGTIKPENLRQALIDAEKLTYSNELYTLLRSPNLGDVALEHSNNQVLNKEPNYLADLFAHTANLMTDIRINQRAGDRVINITPNSPTESAPNPANARAQALLNGVNYEWITITCKPTTAASGGGGGGGKLKAPFPLIIGETKDDLSREKFADQKFGKISLTSEDGDTTATAKFALGLARRPIIANSPVYWTPYLEYNRKTAETADKEVNEVNIGASFLYDLFNTVSYSSLEWQTDDKGKASVWNIETRGVLPTPSACISLQEGWYLRCGFDVAADYVDVQDAGENSELADKQEYARLGGDISASISHELGLGLISLSAGYHARFDISGEDATAELSEVALAYEPDKKKSHFEFSASYQWGKEIGTLTDTDVFTISIGYRQ